MRVKADPAMIWKGRELRTIGELMTGGIDQCATPDEAQAFMAAYRSVNPHADVNIGYLSGYYSQSEARRIREWFGVTHPIFGHTEPSAEQAFEAGRWLAQRPHDL